MPKDGTIDVGDAFSRRRTAAAQRIAAVIAAVPVQRQAKSLILMVVCAVRYEPVSIGICLISGFLQGILVN